MQPSLGHPAVKICLKKLHLDNLVHAAASTLAGGLVALQASAGPFPPLAVACSAQEHMPKMPSLMLM